MTSDPVPRSLVAVDIEGYSSRDNQGQAELRKKLREVCEEAFSRTRISPDSRQDQGDSFLFLFQPDVSKALLASDLIREIGTALRLSNRSWLLEARMRLRVAVHYGEVHLDGTGYAGESVVTVMRLLDAQPLRNALKTAPDDLAVIVSEPMYRDVVRHQYRGMNPSDYVQVQVSHKEFSQPAWIRVPGTRPDSGAEPPGGTPPPEPNSPGPSAPMPSGMNFPGPMTFHGPTSFGGNAAGRDIHIAGRDFTIGEDHPDD